MNTEDKSDLVTPDEQFRVRMKIGCLDNLRDKDDFLDPEKPNYMAYGTKNQIIIYSYSMFSAWQDGLKSARLSPDRLPEGELEQIDLFLASVTGFKLSTTQTQVTISLPKAVYSSVKAPPRKSKMRVVTDGIRFELWPLDELVDVTAGMAERIRSIDAGKWLD